MGQGRVMPVTFMVRETFLLIRISIRSDQWMKIIINWGEGDHKGEIKEKDYF